MTILFIIDHLGNGGAERVVSVLTNEMIEQNNNVHVLVNFNEKNYHLNPKANYIVSENRHNNSFTRKLERVASIRKTVKKISPDAILSFGYFMNLYSIVACFGLKGKKLIISERTDPSSEPDSRIARRIRNFLYRFCDILVCQTDKARDYFPRKVREKSVVIPNPIMSDLPQRSPSERTNVIVNACRLHRQKNLPLLISAFNRVHQMYPSYSLEIYGDGELKNDLETQVRELGLSRSVFFPGFAKDIHDKMKNCAMFVSSSDYEGISNSMLEAMGMGMPVLCTDCPVGGASYVINNHVNGLLVPVRDEDALVDGMVFYIENQDIAEAYGLEAKKVNELYHVKRISKMWLDLC